MRAVLMKRVGGPEVLAVEQQAEPVILSPRQLKIRLEAAGDSR